MKFITQLCRILVALLFIFSGVIKSNDPIGFSYKLDEYFSVFAQDVKVQQDSLEVMLDSQLIGKLSLRATDPVLHFMLQTKEWTTELAGDSVHPDTIQKTIFSVFAGNESLYNIETDKAMQGMLTVKNSDKVLGQFMYTIAKTEILQKDFKVDASSEIKKESWLNNLFLSLKKYALFFAVFISVIEILLGFALLIGWNKNLSIFIIVLMLLFFTFLTWYSATYNKVTDCGCFGDAIKLTPYQSFYKDLILLVLTFIIIIGKRYIKPFFSNIFSINFLAFVAILAISFALYCRYYLPFMNFLQFKPGNNIEALMHIPPGKRASDHVIITYIYKDAAGAEHPVVYDSDKGTFTPQIDYSKWKYDRVEKEEILEKAYQPPVHDFKLMNSDRTEDYTKAFFDSGDVKILLVIRDLEKTNKTAIKPLIKIANEWQADGLKFWAVTASSPEMAEKFRHDYQLPFEFYFGDDTNLKSITRANPGLLLFTQKSVVKEVWPGLLLPKTKKLKKLAGLK